MVTIAASFEGGRVVLKAGDAAAVSLLIDEVYDDGAFGCSIINADGLSVGFVELPPGSALLFAH